MQEEILKEREKEIIKTIKSVLPNIEQVTSQKESLKKLDIFQTPYITEEYFKKLPLEEKKNLFTKC